MPIILLIYAFSFLAYGQLELSGRVVDNASLLSSKSKSELEQMLENYENKTGNQIVIITVKSLDNKNIEDFGYQLGRQWGIGTKEKNNGVLFIIAPTEREVRIEVGYGLEGILTDAQSKIIIERVILPNFRRGQMDEGIIEGTRAIISTLGEEPIAPESQGEKINWLYLIILAVFILLIILPGIRRRGPRPPFGTYGGGSSRDGGGGFGGGGGSFGGGGASGKWR